jgi:hypothetical protein
MNFRIIDIVLPADNEGRSWFGGKRPATSEEAALRVAAYARRHERIMGGRAWSRKELGENRSIFDDGQLTDEELQQATTG